MPAPLYTADVQIGLGLTAKITITEHEPDEPPPTGAEWAREIDWPIAKLQLDLPARPASNDYGKLHPTIICDVKVLGETLNPTWGERRYGRDADPIATKTAIDRAEYLEDAVAALRARADAELAPIIAHVAKRATRLAEREATLARGRAGRPRTAEPERPIELDAGPRTAATDTTDDNTSQRFALLELDAPAPKKNRNKKAA